MSRHCRTKRRGGERAIPPRVEVGGQLDAQDNGGVTALMHAAAGGHVDMVQRLLSEGHAVRTPLEDLTYHTQAVEVTRHGGEQLARLATIACLGVPTWEPESVHGRGQDT